jgi:hypothetical protein
MGLKSYMGSINSGVGHGPGGPCQCLKRPALIHHRNSKWHDMKASG